MSRLLLIAATLVLVSVCLGSAATARGSAQESWYWQPSLCKSELGHGVQLGTGKNAPSFDVAVAYCVGLHNRCWLKGGARLYKVFKVLVLSKDGIVRSFQMNVIGKTSWSGSVARLIARGVTPSGFERVYGAEEHAAAVHETTLGCADPTS